MTKWSPRSGAWPVSGSVLVENGEVYCLAGRNMFLDGGLRLVRLDPATGRLISENRMDENDPRTGKNLQTLIAQKYMPIANADLLYAGTEFGIWASVDRGQSWTELGDDFPTVAVHEIATVNFEADITEGFHPVDIEVAADLVDVHITGGHCR